MLRHTCKQGPLVRLHLETLEYFDKSTICICILRPSSPVYHLPHFTGATSLATINALPYKISIYTRQMCLPLIGTLSWVVYLQIQPICWRKLSTPLVKITSAVIALTTEDKQILVFTDYRFHFLPLNIFRPTRADTLLIQRLHGLRNLRHDLIVHNCLQILHSLFI